MPAGASEPVSVPLCAGRHRRADAGAEEGDRPGVHQIPFFGSRQIAAYLHRERIVAGRQRIRRLMAKLGLAVIYKRPRTSEPPPQHPVYPDPRRGMTIDRPNQVWCADINLSN